MLTKVLCVLSILVAVFGYYMHQEFVPPNSANPLALKALFTVNRFVDNTVQYLDHVGLVDYTQGKRQVLELTGKLLQKSSPEIETEDTIMAGRPVRIYRPKSKSESVLGPAMVYYHGGGWVIGSIETHDAVTMSFAKEANMLVISVDYRLTPEHSQRDGLDDCVAVTKYVLTNAHQYGVDSNRVVVAGDSAGGNYAAAVSMVLRDTQVQPMPKLQLLIYPVTQAIDLMLPSYQQTIQGPFLTNRDIWFFLSQALSKNLDHMAYYETNTHVPGDVRVAMANGLLDHELIRNDNKYEPYAAPNYESGESDIWSEVKDKLLDPYHYPLMADDLSALPDAYVFTAQYDPLRDDGYLYVKRLRDAGVEVTHYNSRIGWHAMINVANQFSDSMDVIIKMAQFVQQNV